MPRLLIAGYGFLGTALKLQFTAEGWSVDTLSRSGRDGSLACDLSDPDAVRNLKGEYDLIIHCAATGGGGVDAYRAIYLQGCRNLLDRFPGTPLMFTSSTSVYGQTDHSEVREISPAQSSTETASVLRATEYLVMAAGGIALRLSALCGPERCYTLKSFLTGRARLDGKGDRILNFVHRDDVATACVLLSEILSEVRGMVFNVSAMSFRQRECYQMLADHYDRPLPPVIEAGKLSRRRGNSSKIVISDYMKKLGWSPQYTDFLQIAETIYVCASGGPQTA